MVRRLTVEGYDAALARLQQEFELTEAIVAGAKVQLEDTHAGRWAEYQAMVAVRPNLTPTLLLARARPFAWGADVLGRCLAYHGAAGGYASGALGRVPGHGGSARPRSLHMLNLSHGEPMCWVVAWLTTRSWRVMQAGRWGECQGMMTVHNRMHEMTTPFSRL